MYCECGCGRPTRRSKYTHRRRGYVKGQYRRYVPGHYKRPVPPEPPRFIARGEYVMVKQPSHPRANSRGYVYEHVLLAERALGRPLPPGALVHHVDEDGTNNSPGNLVICQDSSYHRLLHTRRRALLETGNPAMRRCRRCGIWLPSEAQEVIRDKRGHQRVLHRGCNPK